MQRPAAGIAALALIMSACTLPTDGPPIWDMTWNVPIPDQGKMSVPVTTLLPSGVTVVGSPVATAFSAAPGTTAPLTRTLGSACAAPACQATVTTTAPKPAFTAPTTTTTINLAASGSLNSATLVAGITSGTATLVSGSGVIISINNGYTFDPINPAGGSPGSITIKIISGTTTIGGPLVLSGGTSAIPAGQTTNFVIPISGTIGSAQLLTVTLDMISPAGNPVAMNATHVLTASATPTVVISQAVVAVPTQPVAPPTDLDLTAVDESIVSRLDSGKVFLTITNPFTAGGPMTVTFATPAGVTPAVSVVKSVTLTAATNATTPNISTVSISLSKAELKSILGKKIQATFATNITPGVLVTVTPTLKVAVSSRMQLSLSTEETH